MKKSSFIRGMKGLMRKGMSRQRAFARMKHNAEYNRVWSRILKRTRKR